jgi:uncharacterized protein (TIGR02996 family)
VSSDPRNPVLEAAIEHDPYDREAYRVYADWLEGQGDPRARLIRLQLDEGPVLQNTAKLVRKLLADHRGYLLGPLASCASALDWKLGFVHAANLSDAAGSITKHLDNVLAHPSSRFLVELAVHSKYLPSVVERLLAIMPATLRKLALANGSCDEVALAGLQLARLRALVLRGRFAIDELHVPDLESAELRIHAITPQTARAVSRATWPKLKHLVLDLEAASAGLPDLAPLFQRADLTSLAELAVTRVAFTDELCSLIVDAPFAPQLRVLELHNGNLTSTGVGVLARGRDRLANLEHLGLLGMQLSIGDYETLDELAIPIVDDERRFDEMAE